MIINLLLQIPDIRFIYEEEAFELREVKKRICVFARSQALERFI